MNNKDLALKVAGSIFLLVALAHFLRLLRRAPLTVSGVHVPLYLSVIGLVAGFLLGIWMFIASNKEKKE